MARRLTLVRVAAAVVLCLFSCLGRSCCVCVSVCDHCVLVFMFCWAAESSLFKFQLTQDKALNIRTADCRQFRNLLSASKLDTVDADKLVSVLQEASASGGTVVV